MCFDIYYQYFLRHQIFQLDHNIRLLQQCHQLHRQFVFRIFDQLLNLSATGIERTAGLTPLLRRNLPHLPGERRKKSVAPEIVDPQLLDRRGIGSLSRPPLHFGERLIDFFYDRIH